MNLLAVTALLAHGLLQAIASTTATAVTEVTLVEDGHPNATIVIAEAPTPAANLAALELQHHIYQMTGARLPIAAASPEHTGNVILVGESQATRRLGLQGDDFESQEYLIQFLPNTLILMGRDWQGTPEEMSEIGHTTYGESLGALRHHIDYHQATESVGEGNEGTELPGFFDDQGTCYATYHFLERFCGVRWYGPTPLNTVIPSRPTLFVEGTSIRRSPDLVHRHALGGGWPIIRVQWNEPTSDQLNLYWRRMRVGGEKWAGNHTIWTKTVQEIFSDPEYQAVGRGNGSQLCYTHPKLVEDVAQAARDFFDGKDLPDGLKALGDYFAVVPDDNASWCECHRCQEMLAKSTQDKRGQDQFSNASNSYYVFHFVNEVAKEIAKTHPDRFIAALAYASYAYPPQGLELEPNASVAPCLQMCYGYNASVSENDAEIYRLWLADTERRFFLWNYFHHPMEPAVIGRWNCFPCFMPDIISRDVKRYVADGIRGVFLCGIGQQLDYYLYMQMAFDASTDYEALVNEFFTNYFVSSAIPMQRFYQRISDINREEGVVGTSPELSWLRLGTAKRMAALEDDIQEAVDLAVTELEKARVDTWKRGVWDYMKTGHEQFYAKVNEKAPHTSLAPGYIKQVLVTASWAGDKSPSTLVNGYQMLESEEGVLGTKQAKLVSESDEDRHWMAYGPGGVWIQFDLIKLHRVDEIRIWNYKQNVGYGLNQRGMKQIRIEYAASSDTDWHLLTTTELGKADDSLPSLASEVIDVEGKVMRLLRITSLGDVGEGNWFESGSGRTGVGLGQVRFYGVPSEE